MWLWTRGVCVWPADCVSGLETCSSSSGDSFGSGSNCSDRHLSSLNDRPAASGRSGSLSHFLRLLTSRSTDSQAVKFWDTYRPDQYRSEPWVHLARGDVLPCVLLWTLDSGYRLLPAGLSVIKSLLSTCRTEEIELEAEWICGGLFCSLCVCLSASILFTLPPHRLSRPALHLAPLAPR